VLRDIRDVPADEYGAELEKRWTSLLSYRYIGRRTSSMDNVADDNTVAIRHDMRNRAGGLLVAPISITSPEGGVGSDLVAVPNPVIHSCVLLDDARGVARMEVIPELAKVGRQMGFSRSRIVDASDHSRVIAYTEGEGISLGTPPPGLDKMDEVPIEVVDSPDLPPLWQVFGGSRRNDGHWTLPELSIETASPDAALHLGPQHVVLETAAMDLAAERAGSDLLQIQAWHVMFLARGKVGPFRVEGSADPGGDGRIGVRLVLHDEGNGDRPITSATAVFRPATTA
jgi:hypothetical protein